MKHNSEAGFTLMEILAAVVIIGVLAAIAVPLYNNHQRTVMVEQVRGHLSTSSVVLETALNANGGVRYPYQDELPESITARVSAEGWEYAYIPERPEDPNAQSVDPWYCLSIGIPGVKTLYMSSEYAEPSEESCM